MKKILVVACLLVLLCGVVSAQEVKVSAPASASSTFTVDIKVSGATNVKGFNFILKYDSALLTADKVEEGSFLKNSGSTLNYPGNSNDAGQIKFGASLTEKKTSSGDGTLATITFTPKATGTATLSLEKDADIPGVLMGANDVISNVKLTGGTVSITGVSAPPATTGAPTTAATTSAATTATATTTGIAGVPTKSPFIESVFVVALLVGMAFVLKSARKR